MLWFDSSASSPVAYDEYTPTTVKITPWTRIVEPMGSSSSS